jgi:hypothetical protein
MSGIYTELAKRRAEQSKEPVSNGSPLPPPQKLVVHTPQIKKETPAQQQTRTVTNPSPALSDSEKVEKYTTHLEPSLVKKIKLAAIEKDIKDYEIVRLALVNANVKGTHSGTV